MCNEETTASGCDAIELSRRQALSSRYLAKFLGCLIRAENRPSYIGSNGDAHQSLVPSPTTIIAGETGSCKVRNTRIYNRAPVESHYRSRDQRCRVVDVTQPSVRLSNDAVDVHQRVPRENGAHGKTSVSVNIVIRPSFKPTSIYVRHDHQETQFSG